MKNINLAIVGVGKIVRDQHLPAIAANPAFRLLATASRNGRVDGVTAYTDIERMLDAEPDLHAVALCMPPQYRYAAAHAALVRGMHVLLEKPPGATVSEVVQLAALASEKNVSLYATWHSRCGGAVNKARELLNGLQLQSVRMWWKEDVRKWHPGQDWIWQAGGLGVFDTGINGLSIMTSLLDQAAFVTGAELVFPQNRMAPIAASLSMSNANALPIEVEFDWRPRSAELWRIEIETSAGLLRLDEGGASLSFAGDVVEVPEQNEYQVIYQHFAELVSNGSSDVDFAPLQLTADAFMLAERRIVEAFEH